MDDEYEPIGTAHSLGEFIDLVTSLESNIGACKPSRTWYRGHPSNKYKLIPTAYRTPGGYDEVLAFNHFWRDGQRIRRDIPTSDTLAWYFAARHHGLPTRLLDWSQSPLVALWFALCDSKVDLTPRVWILNPIKLNSMSSGWKSNSVCIPYSGDEWTRWYLPLEIEARSPPKDIKDHTRNDPVAWQPGSIEPRVVAQHGVFTVHGDSRNSIDSLLKNVDAALCCVDIVGNLEKINKMRGDLAILGVDKSYLMASLDVLAEKLSRDFFDSGEPAPCSE